MKNDYVINMDALTVCYTADSEIIKFLLERHAKGETYETYENWYISPIKDSDEALFIMVIENQKLGTLRVTPNGFVWAKADNKVLYTKGQLFYIEYIASKLNLTPYCITQIDIALDTDRVKLTDRFVKACRKFDTVIKGKRYTPNDHAPQGFGLFCTGSLNNLTMEREPIIKLLNGKDAPLGSLKIYDKTAEIEVSDKRYIQATWGNDKPHWRVEISLRKELIRDYLSKTPQECFDSLYGEIMGQHPQTLMDLFGLYLGRFVYWVDQNGNDLNIFDL